MAGVLYTSLGEFMTQICVLHCNFDIFIICLSSFFLDNENYRFSVHIHVPHISRMMNITLCEGGIPHHRPSLHDQLDPHGVSSTSSITKLVLTHVAHHFDSIISHITRRRCEYSPTLFDLLYTLARTDMRCLQRSSCLFFNASN
jgi:hypothetical protein